MTDYRIICADVLDGLWTLPDASVHCVVTSPPYWRLRDYGTGTWGGGNDPACDHKRGVREASTRRVNGGVPANNNHAEEAYTDTCRKCGARRVDRQLGLEPTISAYVDKQVEVMREVRRVLRDDGVCFYNIGDSYASSGACGNPPESKHQKQKTNAGSMTMAARKPTDDLKPKDLCGVPWRVALALQADDWWWRDVIPWLKRNSMPGSQTDRFSTNTEWVFVFTKSGKATHWTHRDLVGVRKRPKPDYRWTNVPTGTEVAEEPPDWKTMVPCPRCAATGTMTVTEDEGVAAYSYRVRCSLCGGQKETRLWKRENLWSGHDYFWDADAVRVPRLYDEKRTKRVVYDGKAENTSTFMPGNPGGRNRRNGDAWYESYAALMSGGALGAVMDGDEMIALDVNPESSTEAHFATFPTRLVRPLIMAGTSEKGCCPACGAPWVRVVETDRTFESGSGRAGNIPDGKNGAGMQGGGETVDVRRGPVLHTTTTGWRPTCECVRGGDSFPPEPRDPVPCTVLDPFSGSGTTVAEAVRLGRRGIGIELSPAYVELSERRVKKVLGVVDVKQPDGSVVRQGSLFGGDA